MSARLKFDGHFEFSDDKPVECDCGCIVEAGEEYHTYSLEVFDKRANEVVKICFTYCGDTNCLGNLLAENLEDYAIDEEHHIDSAEDSADEYADYQYEDSVTNRLIMEGDF